jgi:hypothetical protein
LLDCLLIAKAQFVLDNHRPYINPANGEDGSAYIFLGIRPAR